MFIGLQYSTEPWLPQVARKLASRVQPNSDGHKPYLKAIEGEFGGDINYAMLVKVLEDWEAVQKTA